MVGEPSFDALGLVSSVACGDPGLSARYDDLLSPLASAGPAAHRYDGVDRRVAGGHATPVVELGVSVDTVPVDTMT